MYVSSVQIVLLASAALAAVPIDVTNDSLNFTETIQDAIFPGTWVSDLFYQALANFTLRKVGSTTCQKQMQLYENHLRNYTSWAVRMAESWDRRPIGILAGNKYHMGVYDECVDVKSPVRGQYCLSEIKLTSLTGKDFSFNRTEDLDNFGIIRAWQIVLGWGKYADQVQRNILNLGICIPDSCSALDLQTSLQKEIDREFIPEKIKAIVKVDPILCTISGDMYPYNIEYYVISSFFVLIALICCCATLYHLINLSRQRNVKDLKETSEFSDSFFRHFSFIESSKELLKFDKNCDLNALYGMKTLTMVFVLFGHRLMYFIKNPESNPKYIENFILNGSKIVLTGMNLVDPFFFASGFIMDMSLTSEFKKPGSSWKKIVDSIIYRIARLLPNYCTMIAITAYVFPHLGDGPLWPQNTWNEAEKCKTYWWANLLFINNFIDYKYQCLAVSWYLSCHVQLLVLGVIIVYVYKKNNKYGLRLLGVTLGLSLFVPFILTLLTKMDGMIKLNFEFSENLDNSILFNNGYRRSYMRAFPFFAGMAISILIEKLRNEKFKFSQMNIYIGTFLSFFIGIGIQIYGVVFYERQRPYHPLEHALYSTISHCTWAIPIGWGCVCLYTSGYYLISKLFNNRWIVPLGKLSYSVYLINFHVIMLSQNTQRLPTYVSTRTWIDSWIYDTFKCYLLGLILYLVVEAPFGNLIKILFGRGRKKKSLKTNETKEIIICVETSKTNSNHL